MEQLHVVHVKKCFDLETKKTSKYKLYSEVFVWCHLESNQGHKDFQSFALPTELWHQHLVLISIAKIASFFQ